MQATVNLPRREVPQSTVVYWFFAALLISLGLHGAFFVWSKAVPVDGLRDTGAPALLPPKFVVKQVNFDPKSLQDIPEKAPAPKKEPVLPEKLVFSDAKPQAVDVKLEVKPVDITSKLVEEKPKAQADPIAMAKLTQSTAGALDRELSSLAGAFLTSAPVSAAQPVLAVSSQLTKGASESPSGFGTGGAAMQGRQSLEDVLGGLGRCPRPTAPWRSQAMRCSPTTARNSGRSRCPFLKKSRICAADFPIT